MQMDIPTVPNPTEIIDLLVDHWDLPNQTQLARHIEVDPLSINQYRKRKTADIQTQITAELLKDIEYLKKQIEKLTTQLEKQ